MRTKLRDTTIFYLRNLPPNVTLKDVAKATDTKVPWLKYLRAGKIGNPGANNLEALWEYFTKRSLL